MEQEIWKDIEGFEGFYQVSNLGRVRGLTRQKMGRLGNVVKWKGKILKGSITGGRSHYPSIVLHNGNVHLFSTVHRLVARTFILNPENKPQVNHKNGIKTDNRVENLEWCTSSENNLHAYRTGLQGQLPRKIYKGHKLVISDVVNILHLYQVEKLTYKEISFKYGISIRMVYLICTRKSWKNLDH